MKKILLLALLFTSISSFTTTRYDEPKQVYSDTSVVPLILAIPLQNYIGKPIDSIFSVLPANFTDRGFKPMGIGYAKGVVQGYGTQENNSCFVEIFIDNFQHLTFPNRSKTTTWNMNLAKLETVSYIKVWKNNICIYGCSNPNYY